ncbi:MAG: lipopolysaccharide biosynthesis protein [Chitinophagaceae bacterium]|nr:MAG: lipopolysaccharide biosynthesis protein [Chitinophagaceae bacterium]
MAEEKKQAVPSDEISLKELILKLQEWIRYLRSKWLIILIAGIIGGGLGLLYSMLKKPQYVATLTFALEEKSQGSQLGAYAGLASQFGINLGSGGTGGAFSGDNIMDLMKSRLMVTKALSDGININGKKESLADYYIVFNHFMDQSQKSDKDPQSISFPVNFNPDSLTYQQDSMIGKFYDRIVKYNLVVDKINKNSSIIAVTGKFPDQLFSKVFTEALVKNVSVFYVQTKTKRAVANVNILQNRLDSVRQRFNAALYGTAVATDANINPIMAVAGVARMKNQTNAQIMGAEYGELVKNLEIAKLALLQETPLIQVIDTPILPLKMQKLSKLKGIAYGVLIGFVLITAGLVIRRSIKGIMKS